MTGRRIGLSAPTSPAGRGRGQGAAPTPCPPRSCCSTVLERRAWGSWRSLVSGFKQMPQGRAPCGHAGIQSPGMHLGAGRAQLALAAGDK